MYKRILVATDGSELSAIAVQHAPLPGVDGRGVTTGLEAGRELSGEEQRAEGDERRGLRRRPRGGT